MQTLGWSFGCFWLLIKDINKYSSGIPGGEDNIYWLSNSWENKIANVKVHFGFTEEIWNSIEYQLSIGEKIEIKVEKRPWWSLTFFYVYSNIPRINRNDFWTQTCFFYQVIDDFLDVGSQRVVVKRTACHLFRYCKLCTCADDQPSPWCLRPRC